MWICLSDAFLSIVRKDCGIDELLVRARRKEHITQVFPNASVVETPMADYAFRARVPSEEVCRAMSREIMKIDYPNFKNSVKDDDLHDAYLGVWMEMTTLQDEYE